MRMVMVIMTVAETVAETVPVTVPVMRLVTVTFMSTVTGRRAGAENLKDSKEEWE